MLGYLLTFNITIMKRVSTLLLAMTAVILSAEAREIRVVGSDVIRESLKPSFEMFTDKVVDEMKGSFNALKKLEDEEADIAIVAIPDGVELPGSEWECRPLAFEAAILAVNNVNPLKEMSFDEAEKLFSNPGIGSWGKIGVKGELDGKSVRLVTIDDRASLVRELFMAKVLSGEDFNMNVEFEKDTKQLEEVVRDRQESIVLMNKVPENGRALSLLDKKKGDEFSFDPTVENVYYGDYPLRLPYYVVYLKKKEKDISEFVSYLYSEGVQEKLRERHLYVVPEKIRKRYLEELDILH